MSMTCQTALSVADRLVGAHRPGVNGVQLVSVDAGLPCGGDDSIEDACEALVTDASAEARELGVVQPGLIQLQTEKPKEIDPVAQLFLELAVTQIVEILQNPDLEHDLLRQAGPAFMAIAVVQFASKSVPVEL